MSDLVADDIAVQPSLSHVPSPEAQIPTLNLVLHVAELMTQLMGAQHTIEEEAAARAALTESAAELAAAAAEQQGRAADLGAQLDELRVRLEEVKPSAAFQYEISGMLQTAAATMATLTAC